jgi:mono/diheme cytochrome c family protein
MHKKHTLFVTLIVFLSAMILAACGAKTGTGEAVNLTGDPVAGKQVYDGYCASCHGPEGAGGVANPGSDDGTVPALKPLDEEFNSVAAMDLVIEHGSIPDGDDSATAMTAFGDKGLLKPQQIADVIAYILELNK